MEIQLELLQKYKNIAIYLNNKTYLYKFIQLELKAGVQHLIK